MIITNDGVIKNCLNTNDFNGLLLRACELNDKENIQLALKKGADVNFHNTLGQTPIMFALLNANFVLAETLFKKGANLNQNDLHKNTLVHYALGLNYDLSDKSIMQTERAKCFRFLCGNGVNCNEPNNELVYPLHLASYYGITDATKTILRENVNVNVFDSNGMTPLTRCYLGKNIENAKLLYEKGADVNIYNGYNHSTFYYVLEVETFSNDRKRIAFELIENGATMKDMKIESATNKKTAKRIGFEAQGLMRDYLSLVLEAFNDSAYNSFINANSYGALYEYLINKGMYEPAKIVIQMGLNLDIQDNRFNDTRLIRAVKANNVKYVQFLLDNGADVNVRNGEGKSATQIAIELQRKDLALYLLSKGGKVFASKDDFNHLVSIMGKENYDLLKSHSVVFSTNVKVFKSKFKSDEMYY